MPARDGMGPMGRGAMTGRGMGWCRDADAREEMPTRGQGFGFGRGGGRGGGWRHRHLFHATGLAGLPRAQPGMPSQGVGSPPTLSKEQYLAELTQQAESIEQALSELKSRIQELSRSEPDS